MKIRTGFVSNSSTSSFLMYGYMATPEELVEMLQKTGAMSENDNDLDDWAWKNEELNKMGISAETCYEGYEAGIGRSWSDVRDDQTGAEFKAEVEEALKTLLGPDIKVGTISAAWRDG